MKLNELFNNPSVEYEWVSDTDAVFEIGDKQYQVNFHKSLNTSTVSFKLHVPGHGWTTDVIHAGDPIPVFKTVIQIIQDYMHEVNPKVLAFSGYGKSRVRFYDRLIKTLLKKYPEYTYDEDVLGQTSKMYFIVKK